MNMVSMYVDIRQAAELLAKFSSGHDLPHVAIQLANKIRDAAHRSGLQFYTQYRDPKDGLMHVSDPANTLGAAFSIAEDEKGKRYVKPNGYIFGETARVIEESQDRTYEPGPHDGEWVAYCVVSIEDVVKHPYFGFPKEKQDRIIEAHTAAAVALLRSDNSARNLPKPLPKQRAQEQAILKTLRELNYDPLHLPKNAPGKNGVKAEVKEKLLLATSLFSQSSFNKAWERLSGAGDIRIS